jgi:hypothetical protein
MSETTTASARHVGSSAQSRLPADSLTYLHSLTADDLMPVCFSESLDTFAGTDQKVGHYKVFIGPVNYQGEESVFVNASSKGVIDGVPCGTTISAYLSMSGKLLEQKHEEFVTLDSHPIHRQTVITCKDNHYSIESSVQHSEEIKHSSVTYSCEDMASVIPEGSNLLLQRLIAVKGLPTEGLELHALNADMSICSVFYRSLGSKVVRVGDKELEVIGIERSLNCSTAHPITWHSYFTRDGHLVERTQVGCTINMRLTELTLTTDDEDDKCRSKQTQQYVVKSLEWESDLQLNSKFLDRKDELTADHYCYMRKHPELNDIVADFLQFLLFRRPTDNVVAVAKDYFSAFLPNKR